MKDDVPLLLRQFPKRHIGAHAHFPGNVLHQRPHQGLPGQHRALIDTQTLVRHKCRFVHRADDARAVAALAGALAVEGKLLSPRREEGLAAFGAPELPPGRNVQRRLQIVAVGAAVACKARIHQAQAVQKLRTGAEGTADAGHTGPLVQGQRRRDIEHLIHFRACGLGHAPPRIGGQGFQIAPRALGIQDPQRKRGFPGAGYTCDPNEFVERDVHVDVFQIVHPRSAYLDPCGLPGHRSPGWSNCDFVIHVGRSPSSICRMDTAFVFVHYNTASLSSQAESMMLSSQARTAHLFFGNRGSGPVIWIESASIGSAAGAAGTEAAAYSCQCISSSVSILINKSASTINIMPRILLLPPRIA